MARHHHHHHNEHDSTEALLSFQVVFHAADVRDASGVAAAVSGCEKQLGLPHIIVNNAAGNFISPTERLSANAFKTIVDIVLLGTANVTLEVRLLDLLG